MSGPGHDRWRGGRGYDHNRQSGPRHHGGSMRDRPMGPQHHGQRGHGGNMNAGASWGQMPAGPSQEQHIPVGGFNAMESKDALRKGYQAVAAGASSAIVYKPSGKDANTARSSGPWGSKPNSMASGKDFFLELRKQISALQQGGKVAGG